MLDLHQSLIWLGKLLLAAILGGTIGWERESHGQSAGLRTNVMVCIGCCLLMMVSLHLEELYRNRDSVSVIRLDPGRIASYAVAGMGFLGAGAIIKGRKTVGGLTTAAGLWLVTGIGLSVGTNYVLPAIFTTIICLLVLYNLRSIKFLVTHDVYTLLSLTCSDEERPLNRIKEVLRTYPGIEIRFINYYNNIPAKTVTYRLRLSGKEHTPWGQLVTKILKDTPGLVEMAWEEGEVP